MISVTVADVAVPNPESEHRVVVLLDEAGRRILPIWIGAYEASAIAMHLTPMEMPRPMTYNFMATLLEEAGVEIDSVTVSALVDDTFYATVRGTRGGSSFEVDARPSDAIALALRTDSPVFVTEEVIAASGAEIPPHVGTDAVARAKGAEDVLGEFRQRQAEEQQQREESRAGKTPEERRQQARVDLLAYVFGTDS